MSRRYTAEEMREMATEAEVIEVADQFFGRDMDTIAAMLRQAADMMERERKFEYTAEYVKRRSGKVCGKCAYHFYSFDVAKRFKYYPLKGEKLRFVRRSVGEWEEIEE